MVDLITGCKGTKNIMQSIVSFCDNPTSTPQKHPLNIFNDIPYPFSPTKMKREGNDAYQVATNRAWSKKTREFYQIDTIMN